jgi:hypothetical protein
MRLAKQNALTADFHGFPRIRQGLFKSERNLFFLTVKVEDLHFDPASHGKFLGRMPDSTPGDIRDMQKAVYSPLNR